MDHRGLREEAAFLKARKPYLLGLERLPVLSGAELFTDNSGGVVPASPNVIAVITNPDLSSWDGATIFPSAAQATAINAAFTATKAAIAQLALMSNSLVQLDPAWAIFGTNATTATVTRGARGGWTLTTVNSANNQVIVGPRLLAGRRLNAGFQTQRSGRVEFVIRTPSVITGMVIKCGLWLTSQAGAGDLGFATDANEVSFRYEDTVASGVWQCGVNIAGVNTTRNTARTLLANRTYRLIIDIDASRVPRFYMSDDSVVANTMNDEAQVANPPTASTPGNFGALTNAITLFPFIGIEQQGASAVALEVLDFRISQLSCAQGTTLP